MSGQDKDDGLIKIANRGQDIEHTNFFDSKIASRGYLIVSMNAGCIRILLPDSLSGAVEEMNTANYVVISKGPSPEMNQGDEMWEIMFEDHSQSPFALFIDPNQFMDFYPSADVEKYPLSVWTRKGCEYRATAYMRPSKVQIPYLKPWGK